MNNTQENTDIMTTKDKSITVACLKAYYAERNPNGHYFDRDTMKFFASKVHKARILENESIVFMTSEKASFRSEDRKFNVRLMQTDGKIETLHKFCEVSKIEANRIYRAQI